VNHVAAEYGRRPFDLATDPGLRFLHVSQPAGHAALVLIAHHMVLDGWAVGLLLREIFTRYEAQADQAAVAWEPAVSAAALSRYQEESWIGDEWNRQAEFWTSHLSQAATVLDLPTDRPRPSVQDPAGRRVALDPTRPGTIARPFTPRWRPPGVAALSLTSSSVTSRPARTSRAVGVGQATAVQMPVSRSCWICHLAPKSCISRAS